MGKATLANPQPSVDARLSPDGDGAGDAVALPCVWEWGMDGRPIMNTIGVLLVDDDPNLLNGLRRLLAGHERWNLMFATNGAEALDLMTTNDVGVVVTDIAMPVMDGEQLIQRMYEKHPNIMPIVLSGHWDQHISNRHLGPYIQFLPKPVPREKLVEAIETATHYAALVAG